MKTVLDGRHHAEVAATAAQCPEEIRIPLSACLMKLTIGGHNVSADDVVDRQAALPHQPSKSAAQREADHSGVRDRASGRRESEGLRFVIEFPPDHAAVDPGGPR